MFSARKSGVPPTHPLLLRVWRIHISSGLKFVSKMHVKNDKVASIILFFYHYGLFGIYYMYLQWSALLCLRFAACYLNGVDPEEQKEGMLL